MNPDVKKRYNALVNNILKRLFVSSLSVICISLMRCSGIPSLVIVIDESCFMPPDTVLHLYVFDKSLNKEIEDIRKNSDDATLDEVRMSDSLRQIMQMQTIHLTAELSAWLGEMDSLNRQFNHSVLPLIEIVPLQISENTGQLYLSAKVINRSPQEIDSLNVTYFSNRHNVNIGKTLNLPVAPLSVTMLPAVNLGIRSRFSAPVNPADFSVKCTAVHIGKSEDNRDLTAEIRALRYQLIRLDRQIKLLESTVLPDLNDQIYYPVSRLLEQKIQAGSLYKEMITNSRSVSYRNIKKGKYGILLYSNYRSPVQWFFEQEISEKTTIAVDDSNMKRWFPCNY